MATPTPPKWVLIIAAMAQTLYAAGLLAVLTSAAPTMLNAMFEGHPPSSLLRVLAIGALISCIALGCWALVSRTNAATLVSLIAGLVGDALSYAYWGSGPLVPVAVASIGVVWTGATVVRTRQLSVVVGSLTLAVIGGLVFWWDGKRHPVELLPAVPAVVLLIRILSAHQPGRRDALFAMVVGVATAALLACVAVLPTYAGFIGVLVVSSFPVGTLIAAAALGGTYALIKGGGALRAQASAPRSDWWWAAAIGIVLCALVATAMAQL